MLDEDDPLFANWDQDETAVAERYDAQDPVVVAAELAAAADARRGVVRRGRGRAVGPRSAGAATAPCSPCESFARYFVHDPVHHLWDVGGRRPAQPTGP